MMGIKLQACPFCGGKAFCFQQDGCHYANCDVCFISIPVKVWNKRSEPISEKEQKTEKPICGFCGYPEGFCGQC
jgi:hypothetical protein